MAIPSYFKEYKDIYVFCDSDPIGYYLSYKKIYYHALEDGLNCIMHYDTARYDNRGHFELKAKFAAWNLIFIQNGYGKYCIDMEVNNIENTKMDVYAGNILEDTSLQNKLNIEEYDIVVANILADVIMPLSDLLKDRMTKDTLFISSGIIDMKKEEVKERLEKNGFHIIEVVNMGDWYSYVCKK